MDKLTFQTLLTVLLTVPLMAVKLIRNHESLFTKQSFYNFPLTVSSRVEFSTFPTESSEAFCLKKIFSPQHRFSRSSFRNVLAFEPFGSCLDFLVKFFQSDEK